MAVENTDREIWREREGDAYADSIHVTKEGAIGIDCGGYVFVKPVRAWHALASAAPSPAPDEVEAVARAIEPHMPAQVKYWQEGGMMRAKLIGPYDPEYVSPLPAARAAISAIRQRAAMDDLLRMDGELYDLPERATALSEEECIEVTAERLRKAAQDWAREMVDKPPYWQALAAAIVPTNQEPRND